MSKTLENDWAFVFGYEDYENAYIRHVQCHNCSGTERIWIKKGIPVRLIVPIVCTDCGCREMR